MSNQRILKEYFQLCPDGICNVDVLTESERQMMRDKNTMFLSGIIQRADYTNGNGRIYPRKILEREINKYQQLIRERRALGELDHGNDSIINLKNVSHMMTEMWWEGNDVHGKLMVLDTPSGKILKELVKGGVNVGISSRALGSVREENGKTIVEDDLQMLCWDCVGDPSTQGAFLHLTEARQRLKNYTPKENRLREILFDIVGVE